MILSFLTKRRSKDNARITGTASEYSWNDESGTIKTLNFNGYLTPLPAMSTGISNPIPPQGWTIAVFNTDAAVGFVKFNINAVPATPVLGTGLPVPPQRYVYFTVPVGCTGLEVSSTGIAVMIVQDSTYLG